MTSAVVSTVSALGPVDPASVPEPTEKEKSAPWIVRKLVGSITGRIVMSSYESLRAAGTTVICLSPASWGDSSPLSLPCIRIRDLAVHTVIVATGGMAAIAAPVMGPVSDIIVGSLGDTIIVEMGLHTGFELATHAGNDLIIDKPINHVMPIYSERLQTTGVKELLITLKYKHIVTDAALGFYRSSVHRDPSLFATVRDYLAVEKGWFSPYLFASARRPIIPRTMKPDIIFCHGPFLEGDYRIGQTLLAESAYTIALCNPSSPPSTPVTSSKEHASILSLPDLSNMLNRSRSPTPEPELTRLPQPPAPRRMVVLLVGLKPHRKIWSTSARPGESVINYILLNGCPAVIVPVKVGAPLVAWDGLTLEQLWKVVLPEEGVTRSVDGRFEGIVDVLFEYLDLCIDWERVASPVQDGDVKLAVKRALSVLVAAAVRSALSDEVKKDVDGDRCGIAMWRVP